MSKLERRITVTAVTVPFIGFIVAIFLLWGHGVSGLDLGIMFVMYGFTGIGITVGFHRLFTHRAFDAPNWLRATLAIAGSMSIQGAVIHWVADHRKHHTFADEPGDPHSPHLHGRSGVRGVFEGWFHSHMGWLFDRKERASARRFARDLREDPTIRFVDKWFPAWALLGLAIPALLGYVLSGFDPFAAFTAYIWGGLVRVFLQHHATWSVNSICHMYGDRPFAIDDQSRNNWVVALVAMGEGWHHNHHAFPTSARHGLTGRQLDPSYAFIRMLEKLGLARDVKVPTEKQIQSKLPGAEQSQQPPVAAAA